MIILPSSPAPRLVEHQPIDFGFVQRPATGAPGTRIDRPGERIKAAFTFPAMPASTASIYVSRLMRAKSEGLRIPFPLPRSQGSPGNPAVAGSASAGTVLNIDGATPGYQILEGYWLNVVDSEGVHYLHNVAADVTVSGGGSATLSVWPPLRADLVDGNLVVLDTPKIEGIVIEHSPIPLPHNRIVRIDFTLEEMA